MDIFVIFCQNTEHRYTYIYISVVEEKTAERICQEENDSCKAEGIGCIYYYETSQLNLY